MPPFQTQPRFRFASLYSDEKHDPAKGNNQGTNTFMSANGPNPTDATTIVQRLTRATLDGPGIPALLLYSNRTFRHIYAPFLHQSAFGAATSRYDDKLLGIDGDLVGSSGYTVVELPVNSFARIGPTIVMTPASLATHYNADPSDHLVGPFEPDEEDEEWDSDLETIDSRHCAYVPHDLGPHLDPTDGLTPSYFFRNMYPVIRSEGRLAENQHLIQYFQVAATAQTKDGFSVANVARLQPIERDEGVHEAIQSKVLGRLFHSPSAAPDQSDGHNRIAREIGIMAASQQRQSEEVEERRLKKEAEKYSLEKQLGKQAVERLLRYNGCRDVAELQTKNIPFVDVLEKLDSAKDSDILEALQEAMDLVQDDLGIEDVDRMPVTPQLMKALKEPWDRVDTDSLTTGIGSNLFLHGPRDRVKSAEQAQMFKSTLFATNAPDVATLQKLYSGEICLPNNSEIMQNFRAMHRLMSTVLRPNHPHIQSLQKVINKWMDTERRFVREADAANDPARGIYLLEALNIEMNEYWRQQKNTFLTIQGWDGLKVFAEMRSKKQWKPVLSESYKRQLQLDLFEGVYGSHRIGLTGKVTVEGSAERAAPPEGNLKKVGEDRGNSKMENQVTNEHYSGQGARIFGRFKKRKDPGTGKEYQIKKVREVGATTPIPNSKTGDISMCLAYHIKGVCNIKCPRSADHIYYTNDEYKPLLDWCETCYPASDE